VVKKKWKWILGAMIALAVLGTAAAQGFQPLKLELLEIEERDIAQTFTEEGLVVSGGEYPVSTVTGGKVVRIPVAEGQNVAKGDLLVEIDSANLAFQARQLRAQLKSVTGEEAKTLKDSYPAELKSQEAAVEEAKRAREAAQKNYERTKALFDAGAVSTVEMENAEKVLKDAENAETVAAAALDALLAQQKPGGGTRQYYAGLKESLQAQIDQLEYQMDQCAIKAPFEGTVAELSVKTGETLSPGSQVMVLLPKGSYKIEVFVLTEDVDDLRTGMEVTVIQDKLNGDITFRGIVSAIAPSAVEKVSALGLEEQRVKVTVLPEVPENMILRPGYALDVRFKTAEEKGRFVVPKTAVFPYEDGDAVWVVRDGKARIQPITTGFENDTEVAAVEGLQKGDFVVLDPQAEGLKEGKRVDAQE